MEEPTMKTENNAKTMSDPALRITDALQNDPRTDEAAIEVINDRGVITLAGEVDSRETREAAAEIARAQPGIISVVNTIRVK
jgi:osmotically-inducible protein OsmY